MLKFSSLSEAREAGLAAKKHYGLGPKWGVRTWGVLDVGFFFRISSRSGNWDLYPPRTKDGSWTCHVKFRDGHDVVGRGIFPACAISAASDKMLGVLREVEAEAVELAALRVERRKEAGLP